ncbi:MAG: amino acid permease [Leifsonia sp.]
MPIDPNLHEEEESGGLKRSMGLLHLTTLGIGATIGTGIFFVLSQAVPVAGPAALISFLAAGIVAGLTAICYAELAGAVPVSGSSYSYAYATLGELAAVVVGGCLLLEYGVSAGAVAVGWSEYLNQFLTNVFGMHIPQALAQAPEQGGIINVPSVVLVALCTLMLVRGTKESARLNTVMVFVKIAVLLLFIGIAVTGWNVDHFANFWGSGIGGVMSAAGIIFFSYIGLDAASTAGAEVKNPRRNLPLAIIIALVVVTALYVAVGAVAIGAQAPSAFKEQEAGLSVILQNITQSTWPGTVIAIGAILSIFSITLVVLYGQTRVLYTMSRDGLAPKIFSRVNARTRTPIQNTLIVGGAVALLAGLLPIDFLAEMTSVGTLVAFLVVSVGVIILRRTHPNLPRSFKMPLFPLLPILSIIGCIWIILQLRTITLLVFLIWIAGGLAWYAVYGYRHSKLGKRNSSPDDILIDYQAVGTSKE